MEVPQVRQEFGSPAGLVNQEFGSPVDLVNQEFGSPAVLVNRLFFSLLDLREVSGRGGGQRRGGRLRLAALQVLAFGICPARPATSDEVRRISVACGEFRPRRLKQNPAVVHQKCIISDAGESHF